MKDYKNNSIQHPKYLFHGSPKKLEVVEQRQAYDSNHNSYNNDCAVFLTSSFLMASAYAFKDKIKALSVGLDWRFEIGYDYKNDNVYVQMDNVIVDDDIEGYIYVFMFDEKYEHQKKSSQYKCHESIKPSDVVKVRFADFKEYYDINRNINKK